jgi:mannosylglycerate hydrolase
VLRDGGRNTIAITLLRCVGTLSRGDGDMPTRPGLAGPALATPEAQCPGPHTFELALLPHPGDWRAMYRDAYTFRAPIYLRRGDEHEGYVPTEADREKWGSGGLKPPDPGGDLPGELSFLAVQPETLVLSAVKRAERDDRLIVRVYNPTAESLEAHLRTFPPILKAWQVNLNEEGPEPLPILPGGGTSVPVAGKEVKTIALALGGWR